LIIYEDDNQKIEVLDAFNEALTLIQNKRKEIERYKKLVKRILAHIDDLVNIPFSTVCVPSQMVIITKDKVWAFSGEMDIYEDYFNLLHKYLNSDLNEAQKRFFWQSFEELVLDENILHLKAENKEYNGFLFTVKNQCGYLAIYKMEEGEC